MHNHRMSRPPLPPLPHAWETAIADWLRALRLSGMSVATMRLRRDHIRTIARRSATAGPAAITAEQLKAICDSAWSLEYRKGIRASLTGFYRHALTTGAATTDVSAALPKVRSDPGRPRPATDDIWATLLATAPARERLMARLAGEAGLRRAEVAQVHRDDLVADHDGWSLIVHGKGNKQRVVPLTLGLATEITAGPHGYLFPGAVDGHLSPATVGVLISRLMPPGWSLHKLRHRFASRAYAPTGNLRAVQEILGHASVATTQRYTAVSSRDLRAVSEAAAWHPTSLVTSRDEKGVPE